MNELKTTSVRSKRCTRSAIHCVFCTSNHMLEIKLGFLLWRPNNELWSVSPLVAANPQHEQHMSMSSSARESRCVINWAPKDWWERCLANFLDCYDSLSLHQSFCPEVLERSTVIFIQNDRKQNRCRCPKPLFETAARIIASGRKAVLHFTMRW